MGKGGVWVREEGCEGGEGRGVTGVLTFPFDIGSI